MPFGGGAARTPSVGSRERNPVSDPRPLLPYVLYPLQPGRPPSQPAASSQPASPTARSLARSWLGPGSVLARSWLGPGGTKHPCLLSPAPHSFLPFPSLHITSHAAHRRPAGWQRRRPERTRWDICLDMRAGLDAGWFGCRLVWFRGAGCVPAADGPAWPWSWPWLWLWLWLWLSLAVAELGRG
jgi:hypothetical protein